jgi:hypothetical protein
MTRFNHDKVPSTHKRTGNTFRVRSSRWILSHQLSIEENWKSPLRTHSSSQRQAMTSERKLVYVTYNSTERTFPEQPKAPQLGKNEILAQHKAQHKINLDSSTASLLLPMMAIAMDQWWMDQWLMDRWWMDRWM